MSKLSTGIAEHLHDRVMTGKMMRLPTSIAILAVTSSAMAFDGARQPGDASKDRYPGAASRPDGQKANGRIAITDYGAVDDNKTPNTAAVQGAVDAASKLGRSLHVTASDRGNGRYRIGPNIDWKNVDIEFDEGAGFANLDGSSYTGSNYTGFAGLPGVFDPSIAATGRRVSAPGRDTTFLDFPHNAHQTTTVYNGTAGVPYEVLSGERMYHLSGQTKLSSGSWSGQSVFANIYNHWNGPGFDISCQATNGSPTLTACTPSPTGTHEFTYDNGSKTQVGNVYNPARLTSPSPGIPIGAYAAAWDASTIKLGQPGQFNTPVKYTGATGRILINIVSGRAEFNTQSLQIRPIGTSTNGGPRGGMNWYNDDLVATNASNNPADQEGFLTGREIISRKNVPGNLKDPLHNGSSIVAALTMPLDGVTNYPLDDGIAITGFSGSFGISGGQDAKATYGAYNGLRIGGGCHSVYCYPTARSFFRVGISIQDYEVGMEFDVPHAATFSGVAINVKPGAGNVAVGDNVIVGGNIIEQNARIPASSTAPCTTGQRQWDANYEYRCVATNTWKRAALSSW